MSAQKFHDSQRIPQTAPGDEKRYEEAVVSRAERRAERSDPEPVVHSLEPEKNADPGKGAEPGRGKDEDDDEEKKAGEEKRRLGPAAEVERPAVAEALSDERVDELGGDEYGGRDRRVRPRVAEPARRGSFGEIDVRPVLQEKIHSFEDVPADDRRSGRAAGTPCAAP